MFSDIFIDSLDSHYTLRGPVDTVFYIIVKYLIKWLILRLALGSRGQYREILFLYILECLDNKK